MKRFEAKKAYLVCMVIMTVFLSILSGCGGGGGGHWNEPKDTTRPMVMATVPATTIPGPTLDVPTNTTITVAFTEDMSPATLNAPGAFTVTGPGATPVTGAVPPVTYDVASRTATFHPAAELTGGVTYTVTIKGTGANAATDSAVSGNALAGNPALPLVANDYVWSFTTRSTPDTTLPVVTATVPATTNPGPTLGVPPNTAITVKFSEDMSPATITAPGAITVTGPGATPVQGAVPSVTYDVASRTATFHPAAALTGGVTYTVTIKGTGANPATDSALPGNALAGNPALPLVANDYVWSFTTSLTADTTRPRVTVTVPATTNPGPTPGVPPNTAITATFTKDMSPATITAPGAITVTGPGATPVQGAVPAVTYDVASRTATFHPAAALTGGVTYTVTIKGTGANAVTDLLVPSNALAGNPALPLVANDYVWSFTTSPTADTTRPRVTVTVPATTNPGPTQNVSTSTLITATFNENMSPATITAPGAITVTGPGTTPVQGTVPAVTYDVASRTAIFHPAAALAGGVTYTVTIKGTGANAVTDLAIPGNALAGNPALPLAANDYVWRFTTEIIVIPPPPLSLLTFGIASAGGITNAGATKINGNVVVDPTATCNLEPILFADGPGFGVCGGNLLNIPTVNAGDQVITPLFPDTTTAHAVTAALNVKWNSISPALRPGATVLGCGTIGSAGDAGALIGCSGNSTLQPGTYISATGTTIGVAGDLTLSGGPTDEWYFQAPSALTTAVTSRIILTGGAKASNVWWFVGSSATINTGTIFQGNILASASISMQNGATSCGRLLAGAEGSGAFTFLSNTVSVPGHPNAPPSCQ